MEFKKKTEIVDAVRRSITTKKEQAIKAMLRIYQYQTDDEKLQGTTTHDNGVGFTGRDAEILTSFSKQVLTRGALSEKQMGLLFKMIGKYANQLVQQAVRNGMYEKRDGVWVTC